MMVSKTPKRPLRIGVKGTEGIKVIHDPEKKDTEAYDLGKDRFETNNLSSGRDEHYRKAGTLMEWFKETRTRTGDTSMSKEDKDRLKSLGYTN